jgi:phage protein D
VPSSFQVLFGDQPATAAFYDLLTSLEVEENADLPGAIQMTLPIATQGATGSEDLTVLGDDRFKPYARIAVVVSVDRQPDACIFDGYVLSHKIHLDRGTTASSVQVWGQDASCLMNLEEQVREWKDSDGRIANTIFERYQFRKATENLQDDSGAHPETGHTVMQRATDAQFLRDRARREGKLFRVCCDQQAGSNTGYFIKPNVDGSPAVTLVLNPADEANVDTLEFEWDVARPTEVIAKALVTTKDPVDGDARQSGLSPLDSRSLASFTGSQYAMKARLTATVDDAGELRGRAESLLREAGWFAKCEGEADLSRTTSVLRVGTLAQINGAGKVHSGKYFVWSVRHSITTHSHRMKFVLVRNAVGGP